MTAHPRALLEALSQTIVGHRHVLEALVYGLIADGHVLLEGPPGVAKTLSCRALAAAVSGTFRRVQFTPDLLPSDIVGTRVFDQRTADFTTVLGPIFANIVLADEINRAPAKVQSALLEGMQERQVTIGTESHPLPDPFIVMATMNPLDAEGTYALPFAQMDRFLVKLLVGYPRPDEELLIVDRFAGEPPAIPTGVVSLREVMRWRGEARAVHLDRRIARYIVDVVGATRQPREYVERGASPRGTLALATLARARAYADDRGYVLPEDVKELAPAVLRHRVALQYRVTVDAVDAESLIAAIISSVPSP